MLAVKLSAVTVMYKNRFGRGSTKEMSTSMTSLNGYASA